MNELDIHAYIDGNGGGVYKLAKIDNLIWWSYIPFTSVLMHTKKEAIREYKCQYSFKRKLQYDSNGNIICKFYKKDLSDKNLIEPSS